MMKFARARFAAMLAVALSVVTPLISQSSTGKGDFSELRGSWTLVLATMDGRETHDPELANSTWTFRDYELILETSGKGTRFRVKMDTGAQPSAFHVTPVEAGIEPSGWMIFSREPDRLKIAFFDNLKGGRPQSFEPGGKLLVLTLAPKGELPRTPVDSSARERDPCKLLRAAGVTELLGDTAEIEIGSKVPGSTCGLQGLGGEVVLILTGPPMGKVLFDARRQASRRDARIKYQDEPELGFTAFSRVNERERRVEILALKDNVAVALHFDIRGADQARLRQFARRVLAKL